MSKFRNVTSTSDAELDPSSRWKLRILSLIFVLGMFALMEAMRYALVADLGRHRERLLAEGISSVVFGLLLLKWLESTYRRRQQAIAQMRRVLEVNDRIRNALEMISLSAYVTQNQEAIRVISEGVNRIEFVLRDVLPGDFYFAGGAWRHAGSAAETHGATEQFRNIR